MAIHQRNAFEGRQQAEGRDWFHDRSRSKKGHSGCPRHDIDGNDRRGEHRSQDEVGPSSSVGVGPQCSFFVISPGPEEQRYPIEKLERSDNDKEGAVSPPLRKVVRRIDSVGQQGAHGKNRGPVDQAFIIRHEYIIFPAESGL